MRVDEESGAVFPRGVQGNAPGVQTDVGEGAMRADEELGSYLQVVWRYKWMIAACAVAASVVALGISLLLTPIYSGMATLRVAAAPIGASDYISIYALTRLSNTYVEIATSDASLDEVAERLGLEKQPKVEVEVVPETELIMISAYDPDPIRARDIANTLANMMVEQGTQFYGGDAPTARQILETQLAQAKADLDVAVSDYDAALRNAATPSGDSTPETPVTSAEVETLARLVSVRQQIYGDLIQRYEDTRISEQVRANAITIVDPASLALRPATPRVPLNAALGLAAGLAVSVLLAFLLEAMDDTVQSIEEIQAMTALPILGLIPERKRTVVSVVSSFLSRADRLLPGPGSHQLAARLLLSEAISKSTSFLITSAEPGAGKSTVAATLAISLAESGCRVVLADLDFHRPRQHSIFGLPNELGVSDYMGGKIQLDAALQHTRFPSLRVAAAGAHRDGTSEWLAPAQAGALLECLGKDGDYVLIDAPAWLSVAHPAVVASQADAVILVVARRVTRRKQLRFALQQLVELKARVAGIVLNRASNTRLYYYYAERSAKKAKPGPSEEAQRQ